MTAPPLLETVDGPDSFSRHFNVSRETIDKLTIYVRLLEQWQTTINLVAPATLAAVWHRHIADSAQLLALAPSTATSWVDLGSGAGFPGLVLAILLSDQQDGSLRMTAGSQEASRHAQVRKTRFTLVESDTRKVAFLREVARQVGLSQSKASPVDIWHARIESPSTHVKVGTVDVVTARALAPLPRLLGLCQPFFGPATVALLLKGREADRELEEARSQWRIDAKLVPSLTELDARIAVVSQLQAK